MSLANNISAYIVVTGEDVAVWNSDSFRNVPAT